MLFPVTRLFVARKTQKNEYNTKVRKTLSWLNFFIVLTAYHMCPMHIILIFQVGSKHQERNLPQMRDE